MIAPDQKLVIETAPPPQTYRVRRIGNGWFVRLYADATLAECVNAVGPFATIERANEAGEATGLPDGDAEA